MQSDGEFNRAEKNVVGAFGVAFGIPSDRVAAINDALHGRATPADGEPCGANRPGAGAK